QAPKIPAPRREEAAGSPGSGLAIVPGREPRPGPAPARHSAAEVPARSTTAEAPALIVPPPPPGRPEAPMTGETPARSRPRRRWLLAAVPAAVLIAGVATAI